MASKVTSCLDGFQCCQKDGAELNLALRCTHPPTSKHTHYAIHAPERHEPLLRSTIHQSDAWRIKEENMQVLLSWRKKKKKHRQKEEGVPQVHSCQSLRRVQRPVLIKGCVCLRTTQKFSFVRALLHRHGMTICDSGPLTPKKALYIITNKKLPVWQLLIIYNLRGKYRLCIL